MYFKNKLFSSSIIMILILNILLLSGCNDNVETINDFTELQNKLENYKKVNENLNEQNTKKMEEIKDLSKLVKELNNKISIQPLLNNKVKDLQHYISMINENKNNIQKLEPQYLLNVYDPVLIKKGDNIAGLVVKGVDVKTSKDLNLYINESIKFKGSFNLEGKIYNADGLVQIVIDKSQFINIPIHIDCLKNDSKYIIITNGDKLLKVLGEKYKDGIEVTAKFNGYWDHATIEAEKTSETEFTEIVTIHK